MLKYISDKISQSCQVKSHSAMGKIILKYILASAIISFQFCLHLSNMQCRIGVQSAVVYPKFASLNKGKNQTFSQTIWTFISICALNVHGIHNPCKGTGFTLNSTDIIEKISFNSMNTFLVQTRDYIKLFQIVPGKTKSVIKKQYRTTAACKKHSYVLASYYISRKTLY